MAGVGVDVDVDVDESVLVDAAADSDAVGDDGSTVDVGDAALSLATSSCISCSISAAWDTMTADGDDATVSVYIDTRGM